MCVATYIHIYIYIYVRICTMSLVRHQVLVKHPVAEGRESGDPGKGPPAHCKTCSLHRKHAIELCLQGYTSDSISRSHEQ